MFTLNCAILVLGVKDAFNFSLHHSPHGVPVGTVAVAARAVKLRIEVEVIRTARVGLVERSQPIVAGGADGVKIATVAIAGSREENTIAVRAGYFISIDAVLCGPCPGTFGS